MKKFLVAIMAIVTLFSVSCNKENEKTEDSNSIEGRWDASRSAENPDDIAFVAIFTEENLDLYIIAWGQHIVGTYTLTDGTINYNITAAYQAYTDVTFDGEGNMTSWSWSAGNLDATTLTLSEGYDWYVMNDEEFNRTKEDFGEFEFIVNGNTATSTILGMPNLLFRKVQ